jgi:NADH-quinone oxidoreductase subunit H
MAILLFLGGWEFLPFFPWEATGLDIQKFWFIPSLWFLTKLACFMLFFVWVRWTVPRFRYDQLMGLGWKTLVPLSLANIVILSAVMAFKGI